MEMEVMGQETERLREQLRQSEVEMASMGLLAPQSSVSSAQPTAEAESLTSADAVPDMSVSITLTGLASRDGDVKVNISLGSAEIGG